VADEEHHRDFACLVCHVNLNLAGARSWSRRAGNWKLETEWSNSESAGNALAAASAGTTGLAAFTPSYRPDQPRIQRSALAGVASSAPESSTSSPLAQSIVLSLVNDEGSFSSVDGADKFAQSCAADVVYEDCYEPQPIVGSGAVRKHLRDRALQRSGEDGSRDAGFRLDKITDGARACGFAWTWTSGDLEGLRGTTYLELNDSNQIQYVREIPEPIYKPGDAIVDLLKAVTKDATPKPPPEYTSKTPSTANEIAKYLFDEVQGADVFEALRFFDESIIYRDFNYEELLRGKGDVEEFIKKFSFPGIQFATQRFDDGIASSCFTWEVLLEGAPENAAIKGISFYEIDTSSGLITYVRDIPEPAIKPAPLGKLARQLRPALGVFAPAAKGSREEGL